MITNKTLLILGAGASCPYGLPLGSQLTDEIRGDGGNTGLRDDLKRIPFVDDEIGAFQDAFSRSGQKSIDVFLERRQEFMRIGKISIARQIARKENETKLWDRKESLYQLLWERMETEKITDFHRNQIKIITFNYDRSLEHYLFEAMKNTYNCRDDDTGNALKTLEIIHIHGQIGQLPWQAPSTCIRSYTHENSIVQVRDAAALIQIVHEPYNNIDNPSSVPDRVKRAIAEAEQIYFIGFSFNGANMRKLFGDGYSGKAIVQGTCLGMNPIHEEADWKWVRFRRNMTGYDLLYNDEHFMRD